MPAWWMFEFSTGVAYVTDIMIYYRENCKYIVNIKQYLSSYVKVCLSQCLVHFLFFFYYYFLSFFISPNNVLFRQISKYLKTKYISLNWLKLVIFYLWHTILGWSSPAGNKKSSMNIYKKVWKCFKLDVV